MLILSSEVIEIKGQLIGAERYCCRSFVSSINGLDAKSRLVELQLPIKPTAHDLTADRVHSLRSGAFLNNPLKQKDGNFSGIR
jgi:hypothetical protein